MGIFVGVEFFELTPGPTAPTFRFSADDADDAEFKVLPSSGTAFVAAVPPRGYQRERPMTLRARHYQQPQGGMVFAHLAVVGFGATIRV